MKRALAIALATTFCAGPLAFSLDAQAQPRAAAAYKAPRNALGQPDLEGHWTNATITPTARAANLGDRLVYTPEEVAQLEGNVAAEVAAGNQATDPNAPATYRQESNVPRRPEFEAAGGAVGGYNRGWLEPGSTVMRVNGQPRTSLITTPNGRPPPAKPGAAQAQGGGAALTAAAAPAGPRPGPMDNPETRGLGERCIISFGRNSGPPMFPNGFYNNNYHIVQSKDAVAITVEMVHDTRIVRLNSKHRTDGVRPYFGDSIGWWEGDTLVVETTNMPRNMAYSGSWENLKVTERFTRVGPDRLHYRFTVEDPTFWDAPWGGEYEFSPLNGIIQEYACHEGNYALEGILAGARAQEAESATRTAAAPGGAQ